MSDGRGTSEVIRFELDGVKHYTTVVTMPNGEMRYFTNRVRPEYDTEQGRRFGCAWEYVSAVIIPPSEYGCPEGHGCKDVTHDSLDCYVRYLALEWEGPESADRIMSREEWARYADGPGSETVTFEYS